MAEGYINKEFITVEYTGSTLDNQYVAPFSAYAATTISVDGYSPISYALAFSNSAVNGVANLATTVAHVCTNKPSSFTLKILYQKI